jgi:hypothetical protein
VVDSSNFGADEAEQQQVLNELDEVHLHTLFLYFEEADEVMKEIRKLAVSVVPDLDDSIDVAAASAAPTPELRPQLLPPVLPALDLDVPAAAPHCARSRPAAGGGVAYVYVPPLGFIV